MRCEECDQYTPESSGSQVRANVHPRCYQNLRARCKALVSYSHSMIRELGGNETDPIAELAIDYVQLQITINEYQRRRRDLPECERSDETRCDDGLTPEYGCPNPLYGSAPDKDLCDVCQKVKHLSEDIRSMGAQKGAILKKIKRLAGGEQ